MRKFIKSSVLTLTLVVAGSTAIYAQAPQDQGQRPHGQFQHRGPNPEFQTKMLTKRLNLSPEQAAQVEPILAANDEQLKALKPAAGTTPDFKAMHEQRKTITESTDAKLNAIFSQEQQAEFARMHDHKGGHGPRGNWKPQGTAPPA
jgi:protein CpxP